MATCVTFTCFRVGAYFAGVGDNLFNITSFILYSSLIAHLLMFLMIILMSKTVLTKQMLNIFNKFYGREPLDQAYYIKGRCLHRQHQLLHYCCQVCSRVDSSMITPIIYTTWYYFGYYNAYLWTCCTRGLGELSIFLAFDPFNNWHRTCNFGKKFCRFCRKWISLIVFTGIPMGRTITIFITEFPDMKVIRLLAELLIVTLKENSGGG